MPELFPRVCVSLLLALSAAALLSAGDITLNVTYVCSGERLYFENCNIRDTSDTSTCMVGHPDRPGRNGLMAYTTETRGTLKKLLPTCTQPSARQLAAAQAFAKKQQDLYDANVQKANNQLDAPVQPASFAQPSKPKTPEQRAINRCITSGRLPASCTGNALLGAFGQMLSQVLPSATQEPRAGPSMAGVFQGPGNWRLDFIDGGVLVNCSVLAPDQHHYTSISKATGPLSPSIRLLNHWSSLIVPTEPSPVRAPSSSTESSWPAIQAAVPPEAIWRPPPAPSSGPYRVTLL